MDGSYSFIREKFVDGGCEKPVQSLSKNSWMIVAKTVHE
ncbi:MAG: hypothetical protein CNIPEHKO_00360 [Anaerolineales bacterium]|nr:hypothetical protein [Anaerolineales bacterium]